MKIRGGRRTVTLTREGGEIRFFDVEPALASAARLAAAVLEAPDLDAANEALHELGVYTELDHERDNR